MFCRCKKAPEGFTRIAGDLWGCTRCSLPTRQVFEGVTHGMYILAGATALLSYEGHGDGRATLTWGMADGSKVRTMVFKPYPRKVDMDQGRNILVELWRRLDSNIEQIRSIQTDSALLDYEKAQANCMAATIALIMPTYYEDSTAVLRESMNRWKAHQADEEHVTPGLAESIWDPSTRADGTPWSRENESKARSEAKPRILIKLDDQKTAFVKHSLANGVLTAEKMAEMFGCTVDDIKAANDS